MSVSPRLSRSFLFPGPQPPLSPLGLALLEESLLAGFRHAFYQLGLPLPEKAPVAVADHRLALDAECLEQLLAGVTGGAEVIGALLDPAGTGALPAEARRLAAAASFYRLRLTVFPSPRILTAVPDPAAQDADPARLWDGLRREAMRRGVTLGEALLSDLLAALKRRDARARGKRLPPCLSREAWRLRMGRKIALDFFGLPDPLLPSWAAEPEKARAAVAALAAEPLPAPDSLRGRFRHTYRACLDRLAPYLLGFAACAATRGLLADADDLFFLTPEEVEQALAGGRDPRAAVTAARRDHAEASQRPDTGADPPAAGAAGDPTQSWACAPLALLP